eukprot:366574-Chlamydomonas_euryale.AAC.5
MPNMAARRGRARARAEETLTHKVGPTCEGGGEWRGVTTSLLDKKRDEGRYPLGCVGQDRRHNGFPRASRARRCASLKIEAATASTSDIDVLDRIADTRITRELRAPLAGVGPVHTLRTPTVLSRLSRSMPFQAAGASGRQCSVFNKVLTQPLPHSGCRLCGGRSRLKRGSSSSAPPAARRRRATAWCASATATCC